MPDAQLVIGAPIGALEQAPERFQTIGMHRTVDVLARTVPHRLVPIPQQLPKGVEIIGMQPRAGLNMGGDEPMQARPIAHLDGLNLHLLTAARLGPNHRRLAGRPAALTPLLRSMAVLFQPANKRLIHLHHAGQQAPSSLNSSI